MALQLLARPRAGLDGSHPGNARPQPLQWRSLGATPTTFPALDPDGMLPHPQSRPCARDDLSRRRGPSLFCEPDDSLPRPFWAVDFSLLSDGQSFSSLGSTSRCAAIVSPLGRSARCVLAQLSAALSAGRSSVPRPLQNTGRRGGNVLAELWPVHRAQSRRRRHRVRPVAIPLVQLPRLRLGGGGSVAGQERLL